MWSQGYACPRCGAMNAPPAAANAPCINCGLPLSPHPPASGWSVPPPGYQPAPAPPPAASSNSTASTVLKVIAGLTVLGIASRLAAASALLALFLVGASVAIALGLLNIGMANAPTAFRQLISSMNQQRSFSAWMTGLTPGLAARRSDKRSRRPPPGGDAAPNPWQRGRRSTRAASSAFKPCRSASHRDAGTADAGHHARRCDLVQRTTAAHGTVAMGIGALRDFSSRSPMLSWRCVESQPCPSTVRRCTCVRSPE